MVDERKSPDEYEYPSEEYYKGSEYIPDEEPLEPLETGIPKRPFISRRILLLSGLALAVVFVYLLLSFTGSRRAELAQPTPVAQTPIPVQQAAPVQQVVAAPDPTQTQAFQNVAQQTQINQQNIANLQNQMQQLQSQLGDITNSISNLNNQLQTIANEIRAISIDRSLKNRNLSLAVTGIAYSLKALVPGRAWLQARDGSTTTVTLGDRLPGYGIIQSINTDQGIVTTSSGALIGYGSKDS